MKPPLASRSIAIMPRARMFRLCIDLVTRPLLPDPSDSSRPQPNHKQRRDLVSDSPGCSITNFFRAPYGSSGTRERRAPGCVVARLRVGRQSRGFHPDAASAVYDGRDASRINQAHISSPPGRHSGLRQSAWKASILARLQPMRTPTTSGEKGFIVPPPL
jgi:hypothetical protein